MIKGIAMVLHLSSDQMTEFEKRAAKRFHQSLESFLREEMPDTCLGISSEEMQAFIRRCEERCNHYGIYSDASISQFACLSIGAAVFVDELPGANEILTHIGIDPEDRLDRLVAAMDQL